MIILGIDPGIAIVGFGLIKYERNKFEVIDYGVLTTPAHTPVHERLVTIYDDLQSLIKKYNPEEFAIEELFFNTNQKTVIQVCEARGILLLAAQQNGLEISEYTPLQVKQSVVGYGRAEKIQVMSMTKNILKMDKIPKPDDAADALAIAICHAHSSGANPALHKLLNQR